MPNRVSDTGQQLNSETVDSLQELVQALRDSVKFLSNAADEIDDDYVSGELKAIAAARQDVCGTIIELIPLGDEKPAQVGTFLGSLRTIWMAFRAGLNSGDATVVLNQAERAEDVIVNKFKDTLPEIAGNPVNNKLLLCFEKVKAGHDRVLALRNAYQNA